MATLTETIATPSTDPYGFWAYGKDERDVPAAAAAATAPPAAAAPPLAEIKDVVVPPPTKWTYKCHPRVKAVSDEVDGYFLENWNFSGFKAVRGFLNADFSGVTCLYFPLALDDRIHFACRLLTVLFLIDGDSPHA